MVEGFPRFVLASRSPQRRELLRRAGYDFDVVAPPLPEPAAPPLGAGPAQLAEALAYFKARAVQPERPGAIILAADTVIACGNYVLGKAADPEQARQMLSTLCLTPHAVVTGLAILLPAPANRPADPRGGADGQIALSPGPQERFLASETTHVTMRLLTRDQIDRYVASGEWREKAGAYAIQEKADAFIEKMEGSYSNVVGLPMELIERLFRQVQRCLPSQRR